MKKLALLLLATLLTTSVFAQGWSVGARVGSGFHAVAQYNYNGSNYIEARLGTSWNNLEHTIFYADGTYNTSRVMADFSILHNWHLLDMDWTPGTGNWFVDAGVGVNVGGRPHYAYVGVQGLARMGFTFFDVPVTIALDWAPVLGPGIVYVGEANDATFNSPGIANVGISCIYNF
jgi:hypothetical protein